MTNAVATVAYLQGQAWAKAPDGTLRELAPGNVLYESEVVITAEGARLELDIGGVEALVINGGQEVSMSRDMNPQSATSADEAVVEDAFVQQVLAALEGEGDLLDALEEMAAGEGSGSGGGSNSFVRLERISESTDPQAFRYARGTEEDSPQPETQGRPVSSSLDRETQPVDPDFPPEQPLPEDTPPEISSGSGSVVEDTTPSTSGTLTATDADNPALAFVAGTQSGNYGSLVLQANGEWTYSLDSRADSLAGGEKQTETFTVTLNDGSTTTVTINITGTDDAPVISTDSGSVVEDTAPSTSGTLTATDADNPSLAFVAGTQLGNYGSLVLQANGEWTYSLDSRADSLAGGEKQTETFTVTLNDGSTTTVTINITGTDDAPVISTDSGAVVEDTAPSTSGTLTATDADNPSLAFLAGTQLGNYGSLVLQANGEWTYSLDSRADSLAGGEQQTETFTVTLNDGSTTTVTINITGTDDAPVISTDSGSVVEDTAPSTSGTLTATDADNPALAFVAGTQLGNYGSLVLQTNGEWTYSLDSRADSLAGGEQQTETFTVTLNDGSTTTVTINITGTDDAPVISTDSGSVVEDTTPSTSGTLTATDADNPTLAFVAGTQLGNYGSLVLQANGEWTYSLDSRADTLAGGEQQTETFTVTLSDGSTTTVTINITGTDDAPVISTDSGSVVEDTTPSTSGTLTATDADNPTLAFVAGTQLGNYGSLVLQANGEWTYSLDSRADTLAGGEQQTETFTVTLNDGSTTTVTINITGTDDAPVISTDSGSVVEDTTPSTSGTLTATDADNPALAFVAGTQLGNYGSLVLQTNGEWTYSLDSRADSLAGGEKQTETFTVTLNDGSTTTVTINITGTDDAPVISTDSGAVVEDTAPSTSGTLTATDADNPTLAFLAGTQLGNYGSLVLQANGEWTYSLDSRADSLAGGEQQTETFTVTLNDGSTTTVTINITGTDDAPVISTDSGSVVEDTAPSTSGTLTATDVDNPALAFVAGTQLGNYGSLVLQANGEWTYSLDSRADTLAGGEQQTETFTVTLNDGSTTTVTINITGTDDAPVISTDSGSVVEDTAPSTSGTLTATDADNPALAFVAGTQLGNYGSLVLQANGEWTYSLDSRADSLAGGEKQTETFTVTLNDGSTTTVTINITGTDDAPVISTDSGSVVEDTTPSTSGTLTATDADNPALAFVAGTQLGNYGSLVLQANGEWTYSLDSRADSLAGGEKQTETFTVTLNDGSTTTVTINITGTDDAPVISTDSGAVVEDTAPSTSGTLTATDADNPTLAFLAGTQLGNYGSLVLQANGEWTYSLDSRADSLAGGEQQTETFTVTLNDGSTTTVTINITGTDDAPVISTDSGAVVEDTTPSTSGTLTATDADNPALAFVAGTQLGNYGSLVLQANGEWTYSLDSRADTLAGGEQQTETFTVTLNDGSTTTVTINITGTDDAPVISTDSGSVVEDTAPSTSGTLTATDADNPSLAFVAGTQLGNYGSLVLQANGEWTYSLDSRADSLAGGEKQTETFTVTLNDGSTTTVTINITGTDDAPVISTDSGSVVEDTAPSTSGTLTATDADNPALAFVAGTQLGNYGSLVLQANGEWTYSLDSRADSLAGGEKQTETFTVTLNDGSTTTVTINITGTDDAPVISTDSGSVVEDTAPSTSGTLTATDADNPALAFVAGTQLGNYGSLVLQANGEWTYSLDSRADTLAGGEQQTETFTVTLNDGSTTTVTINITGTDDAPVISTDSGSVVEDTTPSTSGTLTATDADNPALAFVAGTQLGNYGSLVLQTNGEWTYSLDSRADSLAGGEQQTETFTVTLNDGSTTTVTINITGTNESPLAVADTGLTQRDTAIVFTPNDLLANDTDPNGDALSIESVQDAVNGTVNINADGDIVFTPTVGFSGQASFSYTISDGQGGSSTATVTLEVNAPPVAVDDDPSQASASTGLHAEYFAYRQTIDGPNLTNLNQVINYIDGKSASATFTATTLNYNPGNVFDNNLGNITNGVRNLHSFLGDDAASLSNDPIVSSDAIIRMSGFIELEAGTYNFRLFSDDGYQIKIDGKTVAEVSKNQSATLTTHPSFTITSGGLHTIEIVYWDQGYYARFSAEISKDGGVSYQAFKDFKSYKTADFVALEDTPYSISTASLLANDSDADGDSLRVVSVQDATHGSVALVGGNIIFTPDLHYAGPASFTYTISDGRDGYDTASVNLVVSPVNDAPVAMGDHLNVAGDKSTTISFQSLLSNDVDVDGDILEIISVQNAQNGTVSLGANGVIFTPTPGFEGQASFEYTLRDPSGLTSTATTTLAVGSASMPAVVVSKTLLAIAPGTSGTSVKFPIVTKLVDTDGSETLSITVSGVPSELSFNAGVNLGGGVWQFTEADLPNLMLNLPGSYSITNSLSLTVQVTSTEANGMTASISSGVTLKASNTTVEITTTQSGNYAGSAANELIRGGDGDNTINAGSGNNLVYGGAGNDTLSAGGGSDIIYGGSGNDIINSGSGTDRIYGGAGNDILKGGEAGETFVDVFAWTLGDQGVAGAPAVDTIQHFATDAAKNNGSGGDVLDLRDLLQGESVGPANSAGNLADYLHFEISGGNTLIHISHTGGFAGDSHSVGASYSSAAVTQQIVLEGVNLQSLYSGATTDQQIITQLLNANKLITD